MSDTAIGQVLAQMRASAAMAADRPQAVDPAAAAGGADFGDALGQALNAVNSQSKDAGALADAFTRGEPGVDLGQVMVNLEKASLGFEAVTQTRNRLLSAYRDIMNMPL